MYKHLGKIIGGVVTLLVAVGLFFAFNAPKASAHEHRDVGNYAITFGWQTEPAYAGVYNGPELEIVNDQTKEPIVGAEETLTLTVKFGPASKVLALKPAYQEPGRYVAQLTPTRAGDYEFELTGAISETTALSETVVNEIFTSADGDFSTIEPSSDVLFPDAKADTVSLQQQIDALKKEVESLKAALADLTEAK